MTSKPQYDIGVSQDLGLSSSSEKRDYVATFTIEGNNEPKQVIVLLDIGNKPTISDARWSQIVDRLKGELDKPAQELSLTTCLNSIGLQSGLEPSQLALTILVISTFGLYLLDNGLNRVYLFDGMASDRLDPGSAGGQAVSLNEHDRLVICSDGTIKHRSGEQNLLLNPSIDLPAVLGQTNLTSQSAAKTLLGLGIGRGADDNVSIIVVAPIPKKQRAVATPLFALLAVVILGVLGWRLFTSMPTAEQPTPTVQIAAPTVVPSTPTAPPPTSMPPTPTVETPIDPGYAIFQVRESFGDLLFETPEQPSAQPITVSSQITAGSTISTGEQALLKLLLSDGTQLIVEEMSELTFEAIGLESALQLGSEQFGPTSIRLERGSMMLHQPDVGKTIEIVTGDASAMLQQTGTISMERIIDNVIVNCFDGLCSVMGGELEAGKASAILPTGTVENSLSISPATYSRWQEICNCLIVGEDS